MLVESISVTQTVRLLVDCLRYRIQPPRKALPVNIASFARKARSLLTLQTISGAVVGLILPIPLSMWLSWNGRHDIGASPTIIYIVFLVISLVWNGLLFTERSIDQRRHELTLSEYARLWDVTLVMQAPSGLLFVLCVLGTMSP